MYEATEVIAEFNTPTEAQLAQARLREEGIEALVTGEVPNAASFSIFGRMPYAPIQLAVAAADAPRARQVLEQPGEKAELDEGWEAVAETAITGWICTGCDTEVDSTESVCPECGASRAEQTAEEDEDQ